MTDKDTTQRKIEYEFEDLRRNSDPVPDGILEQLGLDEEDLEKPERHDDENTENEDEEKEDDTEVEDADQTLDDDGDYQPAKMTKAMRQRLLKVKRDANRRISEAEQEAGKTISKLEKRVAELERQGKTDSIDSEYTERIESIEGEIEEAMEAGDSKKVVELTRKLSELTAERTLKRREVEEPDNLDDDTEDVGDQKVIPRAQAWIDEQDDWWGDPDYAHIRGYVVKVDLALQRKGYNPKDEDYYEELERIVDKRYPNVIELTMFEEEDEIEEEDELDDLDDDGFDITPKKKKKVARRTKRKRTGRRRSPVSEGDRGGTARSKKKVQRKKGKTLTRARVANMRMFGMDPENPEHVEAYLEGL